MAGSITWRAFNCSMFISLEGGRIVGVEAIHVMLLTRCIDCASDRVVYSADYTSSIGRVGTS